MVERCSKERTLYPLFPLFYYSAALFLSQPAVTRQTKPKLQQKMSLNTSHAFMLCDKSGTEWQNTETLDGFSTSSDQRDFKHFCLTLSSEHENVNLLN